MDDIILMDNTGKKVSELTGISARTLDGIFCVAVIQLYIDKSFIL
jgi:hypothetical protein